MSSGDKYEQLVEHFLADQQAVLGDQAKRLADDVSGVQVSDDGSVDVRGDGPDAVGRVAEKFRDVFGQNVEESVLSAAREVDHAVEVPPGLGVDRELRGYTEYKKDGSWHVADELGDVEPQSEVWPRLFGFGTEETPAPAVDVTPIAHGRGVPMDASDTVHEAWIEQKREENGIKVATEHTWITAGEVPDAIVSKATEELLGTLMAAKQRFGPDRARLIVWLRYDTGT